MPDGISAIDFLLVGNAQPWDSEDGMSTYPHNWAHRAARGVIECLKFDDLLNDRASNLDRREKEQVILHITSIILCAAAERALK